MPGVMVKQQRSDVVVEIGGLPIRLCSGDPAFIRLIQDRYAGYVSSSNDVSFEFQVELAPPGTESSDEDLRVYGDMIPVTFVDGIQHDFWRVSEDRLRVALGC